MKKITPFILGRGRAGNFIWEPLAHLKNQWKNQMPEITWVEPVWVERTNRLQPAIRTED